MKDRLIEWIIAPRSSVVRLSIALAFGLVALSLYYVLEAETERHLFFISLASIIASSLMTGARPGLLTMAMTSIGMEWALLKFAHYSQADLREEVLRIGLFALTGALVAALGGALRSALRRALEERNRAQEATRARDEIISIVSHELKTPLTALSLQAQLGLRRLRAGETDRKDQEKLLASILAATGRFERLIEDMLDLSRISAGKLSIAVEKIELNTLARRVIERFSAELLQGNTELSLEAGAEAWCMADPTRIEQVLSNLVSNAIKYGGGTPIQVKVSESGSSFVLTVSDHGPGIGEDEQKKLFQRYERVTKSKTIKGTGLGLYIAKQIVEQHGGRIWLESRPGKGTSFFVALPRP